MKMTTQSLFNKVAKHLLTQGERAIAKCPNGIKVCVCYDEKTGNRCAFGCLLPVKYYKKYGGKDIGDVLDMFDLDFYSEEYCMMEKLRHCHDSVKPSRWPQRLRAIAREHKLEIPDFLADV